MSRTTDHVIAFNHAVTTGDWDTFAARFADDATMTFVNVPAGPSTAVRRSPRPTAKTPRPKP